MSHAILFNPRTMYHPWEIWKKTPSGTKLVAAYPTASDALDAAKK